MALQHCYLAGVHYRQELVRCGRECCRKCPHGPYWYAYTRSGAFLKKTYVGKKLPAEVERWSVLHDQAGQLDQAGDQLDQLDQAGGRRK